MSSSLIPTGVFCRRVCAVFAAVLLWIGTTTSAQILDQTFFPNPSAAVLAVAVQPDGQVWVGGTFSTIGGVSRPNLARLNAGGAIDLKVVTTSGTVTAIAVQPDGKVLVGGSFSTIGGVARGRLARLNANGSVDQAFAPDLGAGNVRAIVVQPDGKIVIGGSFSVVGGLARQNVARLNGDGTGDTNFIADATAYPSSTIVLALALQEDGALLVAGQFALLKGQFRPGLGRIRRDGGLDETFNAQAGGSPAMVAAVAVQRDGKILVGGNNFSIGPLRRSYARLNSDGTIDTSMGAVVLGTVTALAVQPDGAVLIGGVFSNVENQLRNGLARYLGSGTLDPNFGFGIEGAITTNQPPVQAIVATPDGRIYFGGAFATFGTTVRNGLARLVPPTPAVTVQPTNTTVVSGASANFTATVVGSALTYQWRKNGTPIFGATNATLALPNVQPLDAASYDLVATNSLGSVTTAAAALTVALAPSITTQPLPATAITGRPVQFGVQVSAVPGPTYQWQRDGADLPGATSATLALPAVKAGDAGVYRCLVSNSVGSVTTVGAKLTVLPAARLANVSVRTALSAEQAVIVGFAVNGGPGAVLLRAAGPGLTAFGVTTAMADPRIELYREATKLLENDNWPSVLADAFTGVGAFPFASVSRDAALQVSLSGSHSAVVSGPGPGVVLVEAYDLGGGEGPRLVNLSARNRVGTDDEVLIAGFSIGGFGTMRVLIRAVGPTIGGVPFNVPGVLTDPKLELRNAAGVIISENDNWDASLTATFAQVGAFGLAPGGKDAAVLAELTGGSSYSVVVKGADGGTGVALVEIYEVP